METQDQQIIVNLNHSHVYEKKVVRSLVKGQANDFLCLEKAEKGTNLALKFKISKQQISDICKNQEKILRFTDKFKTIEGFNPKSLKVANDEQVDKALYACFFHKDLLECRFQVRFFKKKQNISLCS